MRWEGERQSDNVEDRRDEGGGGGGGFGLPIGGRGIGLGTVAVALVAGWVFGINPLTVLGLLSGGGAPVHVQPHATPAAPAHRPPADDRAAAIKSRPPSRPETVITGPNNEFETMCVRADRFLTCDISSAMRSSVGPMSVAQSIAARTGRGKPSDRTVRFRRFQSSSRARTIPMPFSYCT